ncbi:hypothetical protein NEOLEDRAFT_1181621 [Neolentinus lepideus HHB14362 ss-1]|uniref:Nitrogen regulatory protein areA GATA-like domain-containing protein n=1 Tax=Neolentinus lepideus HHB14362 ss-1 TaxID=1314782 RepID=A0A165PXC5_9AGAM|nr:hypothetical protein NEOLEDRAFT_1181621 [Neolentinus lepideus HHB14362 ss-1]
MANYLPALLVSVTTNAFPDDSSFDTVPRGQVDYLSHQWREEDVWRSWRSMTRQKNAIANGARLENASWRTWWKQRNGLKTISPETLNWLKDSDVTWLYGPFHIGQDWSPPAKDCTSPPLKPEGGFTQRSRRDSTGSLSTTLPTTLQRSSSSTSISGKKPILKHRSIGELLSMPSSPHFSGLEVPQEGEEGHSAEPERIGTGGTGSRRPPLLHTKSDTHIMRLRKNHSEFRKDSPPRIIAPQEDPIEDAGQALANRDASSDISSTSAAGDTPGSDRDSHSTGAPGGKKKHISFNTFVEQFIAIEKPKLKRGSSGNGRPDLPDVADGYEEDMDMEDVRYENFYDEPEWFPHGRNSSESEEEDDEVLEMRSSRSRSSSFHSSHAGRPPLLRMDSIDKGHVTIAPIAPTMLKTTGMNGTEYDGDTRSGESSPRKVELVYVPPIGSNYSNSLPNSRTVSRRSSIEDVYQHREAYLSVGTGSQSSSSVSSPSTSPNSRSIPSVGVVVPSSQPRSVYSSHSVPSAVESPRHEVDGAEVDAYDYFEGVTYGKTYASKRVKVSAPRDEEHEDARHTPGEILRYDEGAAPSVANGRNSDDDVIMEERRETVSSPIGDRERDFGTTHSKHISNPVPVPRVSPAHMQPPSPNLLSPPENIPSRGRSPQVVNPSQVTGDARGRSATRSSSYSDRGRSGSRSSRGGDSPMGSISPCGSSAAVGGGSYGRESRGREGRGSYSSTPSRGGSEDSANGRERGRDRTGRRLSESLSPPSPQVSSSSPTGDKVDSSSSAHGKDVSTSSLSRPTHLDLPPSIPEEDEQRSRNPTPASSPVTALKPAFPIPAPHLTSPNRATPSSNRILSSPPIAKRNSLSGPLPSSSHQRRSSVEGPEQSGLMGRAVSSAREFLGSFWAS